jgi:predicted DCC family thiol-disulfide oxidoreductase YuxK
VGRGADTPPAHRAGSGLTPAPTASTLAPMERNDQAVLLYDSDCGFCRWSTAKILRWDTHGRIRPVALQDREADLLLPEMDHGTRMASWHLVGPDGRVRSAGAASAPLFRLLPGGAPLAAFASTFPRTTERAYRWVADHRDWLGRKLGAQACSVDPSISRGSAR